jgi:hypothetical protein
MRKLLGEKTRAPSFKLFGGWRVPVLKYDEQGQCSHHTSFERSSTYPQQRPQQTAHKPPCMLLGSSGAAACARSGSARPAARSTLPTCNLSVLRAPQLIHSRTARRAAAAQREREAQEGAPAFDKPEPAAEPPEEEDDGSDDLRPEYEDLSDEQVRPLRARDPAALAALAARWRRLCRLLWRPKLLLPLSLHRSPPPGNPHNTLLL